MRSPVRDKELLTLTLVLLAQAIVDGFTHDPGHSDLDDEQPIHVCIPLGVYRKAKRLTQEFES